MRARLGTSLVDGDVDDERGVADRVAVPMSKCDRAVAGLHAAHRQTVRADDARRLDAEHAEQDERQLRTRHRELARLVPDRVEAAAAAAAVVVPNRPRRLRLVVRRNAANLDLQR